MEEAETERVTARPGAPQFLAHNVGDHVAVAVQDVEPGDARVDFLDSVPSVALAVLEPVPLGHKVALTDLTEGSDVIEYGVRIGRTRRPIKQGQLVHVHNIVSARWQSSR